MDEARAFLALPAPHLPDGGPPYDARERRGASGGVAARFEGAPAEAYLRAPGITRFRFPSLRFHPALYHREANRRLPALVAAVDRTPKARSTACTAPGSIPVRPPKAGVLPCPARRSAGFSDAPCASGSPAPPSWSGRASRPLLSIVTAAPRSPGRGSAFAGSLGAFVRPRGSPVSSSPGTTTWKARGRRNAWPNAACGRASRGHDHRLRARRLQRRPRCTRRRCPRPHGSVHLPLRGQSERSGPEGGGRVLDNLALLRSRLSAGGFSFRPASYHHIIQAGRLRTTALAAIASAPDSPVTSGVVTAPNPAPIAQADRR